MSSFKFSALRFPRASSQAAQHSPRHKCRASFAPLLVLSHLQPLRRAANGLPFLCPLCVPPPLRQNIGSRPWRGRAPRPARAARGPRSFHILGRSEFRLRKFSPFGLRIYGAYRAAPSAMGPQKSTTYCALRSTLPAHTGLVPAVRPATVAAKYRISSMAWSCAPAGSRRPGTPFSFHILGGSEFRLRKFSPFGLRIYGAYRAAPSAMGPQKSTTYCTFRSTLPAHTGLVPAVRPATVAAKYRISSMAWSCSFFG